MITTGTASGKSLCFQLPTLEVITSDRTARALYLYPTKSLAQDQARVGYISQLQLTQAESEYQSVLGTIPELELAVRRQENAVRLLAGELPGLVARGAFDALRLPPVPAVLPSQLLARRPDVLTLSVHVDYWDYIG